MEERLSPRRSSPSGMDRNALRIFGLVIAALGLLGRGVLANRLLGVSGSSSAELLASLEVPGAMAAASVSLVLQAIETTAVPIFAVLLADGAERTSDLGKYLLRVAGLALLSELPYHFALSGRLLDVSSRNPVFGMALALAMLYFFRQFEGRGGIGVLVQTAVLAAAVLWSLMFRVQFGVSMILIVWVLWVFRKRRTLRIFMAASIAICCCVGNPLFMLSPFGFLIAHGYNGEEGRTSRVLQYLLYPILLLLIGAVGEFMF